MKLEEHVLYSLDALSRESYDEALMHACVAIDGTTRNFFSKEKANGNDYKRCLRHYYWVIERFLASGVNLEETKFKNIQIYDGKGNQISDPDLADIIYHIFRCNHAHAKEIPIEYELIPAKLNHTKWIIGLKSGVVRMPDTIVVALLAVSLFCHANKILKAGGNHHLWWLSPVPLSKRYQFLIKDWWGKEAEFQKIVEKYPLQRIIINI